MYKYCIVPKCTNTTFKTPEKIFFNVPKDPKLRNKWYSVVNRDDKTPPSAQATRHCCEDHFDVENDMENYIKYKLVGGRIVLKKGIFPHKFECQQRNNDKPNKPKRSTVKKRTKIKYTKKQLRNDKKHISSSSDASENSDETSPQISQKQQKRLSVDDASDGSESPTDLGNEIEVKVEPEDDEQMTMVADPLTQRSAEGSLMSLHSHAPGDPLQPLYLQPSTSTNEAVIKEEIEEDNIEIEDKDYNEMFLKLQQEVETLKADNQRLTIENHNLAREIHNLKQKNDNVQTLAALKDIQSASKDNELLRELAKENQRLSEKIYENMDQIRNITSKYEHDDESKMNINQNFCDKHKKPDNLTDKLRRLTKDNKNIVSERDNLKDEVQNLYMKLENVSEENIALKRNVKLQRKRVERLKIQCGIHSGIIKRLKNNCLKLRSIYSKLKMTRQNF